MADDKAKRIDSNAVKAVAWNPAEPIDSNDVSTKPAAPGGPMGMPPGLPPGMFPPGMMPPGMMPPGMPGMPWMPGAGPGEAGVGPVNEPTPEARRFHEKQSEFMNTVVAASKQALDDLHRGLSGSVADAGFFAGPDPGLLDRLEKAK